MCVYSALSENVCVRGGIELVDLLSVTRGERRLILQQFCVTVCVEGYC